MNIKLKDDITLYKNSIKRLESCMKDIADAYLGWYVETKKFTEDSKGEFSHKNTLAFVNAIASGYNLNDYDKSYISTLLYLVVRAQSAGLSKVLVPKGMEAFEGGFSPEYLLKPNGKKDFRGLKEVFTKERNPVLSYENPYGDYPNNCVVSLPMAATITTIYTMLTDKPVAFPNPYKWDLFDYEAYQEQKEAEYDPIADYYEMELYGELDYICNEAKEEEEIPCEDTIDDGYDDAFLGHYGTHAGTNRTPVAEKYLRKNVFSYEASTTEESPSNGHCIYTNVENADYIRAKEALKARFADPESFVEVFDYFCTFRDLERYQGIEACVPEMLEMFLFEYRTGKLSDEKVFSDFCKRLKERAKLAIALSNEE